MRKVSKSFRLKPETVKTLDELVYFYYEKMNLFNGKKVTSTDIIELLIEKEKQVLIEKGYVLKHYSK